jgi:tetratricopeptide (TPR) repeat protein
MRNALITFAEPSLRALRSGRFRFSSLVARLSPQHGAMMKAYRLEEEGRYEEALAIWKGIEAKRRFGSEPRGRAVRCARLAARAGRFDEALERMENLFARYPNDPAVLKGLESVGLRGARQAQAEGKWLLACRMWAAFHRATGDDAKCIRNLAECARYVAQSADSVEKMQDALTAWTLLKEVDPYSQEAKKGLEWCYLSLARASERSSDFDGARKHWNALLALCPDDQRALDGLRRITLAGA